MNPDRFNPFLRQISEKQAALDASALYAEKIKKSLIWYTKFDRIVEKNQISSLKLEKKDLQQYASLLHKEIQEKLEILESHKASKVSFWRLKTFFTPEQKVLRKKINELKTSSAGLELKLKQNQDRQLKIPIEISAHQDAILKYDDFDEIQQNQQLELELELIAKAKAEISDLKVESKKLTRKLAPELNKLKELEEEIKTLDRKIDTARKFDQDLSDAKNSYDRALIHQECESDLGFSKPRQAISTFEKRKQSLRRNCTKIEKRLENISDRLAKPIRRLIFDGNNLCYCGDKFIGFSALLKFTDEVSRDKLTSIIFDASIRQMTKSSDSQIRKKFGDRIDIHIVATRQAADETILKFSDNIEGAYVVTNDRFEDYPSSKVKTENRMIRHEILPGKGFIHDLDVSIDY